MRSVGAKNLHVPLPPALHHAFMEQARRLGVPATVLARVVIEERVYAAKKAQVAEELRRYVAVVAGTESDLDPAFEAVGVEAWRRLT